MLARPVGGGGFDPASALARAATRAGGPTWPASGSGTGPRASEGEGETTLGGRDGGSVGSKNRSPEFDDGSPSVIRFRVVGEVVKHG
jgi:hypothetical protein